MAKQIDGRSDEMTVAQVVQKIERGEIVTFRMNGPHTSPALVALWQLPHGDILQVRDAVRERESRATFCIDGEQRTVASLRGTVYSSRQGIRVW